jgi:hypothetical protein
MSRGINYAGNVGWTLWNYSKRISAVKYEARGAQKLFDSHAAMNDWPIEDLYDLRDLTNQLQDCAERADETWRKLQEAVNENDSDLIEQRDGIAVIRGGGSRPELRERIRMIYGADTSDADSQKLATSIESLRAKVRKEQGTRSTPT